MKIDRNFILGSLLMVSVTYSSFSYADQDTDLRIQQRDALSSRQNENALIEEELEKERLAEQSASGSESSVANTADELGPALHVAVRQRQWALAESLLQRYVALADFDPMLAHYASGALARNARDYDRAETHYSTLLEMQENFLPAELELARVWFEDRENSASLSLFNDILTRLPADNPRAAGVRNTVESFVSALEYRDDWQGAFSFGPTYNDNLNLSSKHYECLVYFTNGQCFLERSAPKVKSAYGIDYDASLNRRFSLSGHHGLQLRSFAYGTNYQNHKEHNEQTLNVTFGYSYQTAKHQISIAPQFEYRALANQALFASGGFKADWFTNLSQNSAMKLEVEGEYLDYRNQTFRYQSDWQWSVFGTYWHQLPDKWLVFGGVDWTLKQNRQAVHEYDLWGGRLGVNKTFTSLNTDVTLFASLRQRIYGGFNAVLGERRDDTEQNYTLVVTLPELFAGFKPLIEVKANQTKSNVDWAYSYKQHQYSLKLEKRF